MKTICTQLLFLILIIPHVLVAQESKTIIISPRIGKTLDSDEAAQYRLFTSIAGFHSARFVHEAESAFVAIITVRAIDGSLRESTIELTEAVISSYAERIDHWEELRLGLYAIGSKPAVFRYEDGTPLIQSKDKAKSESEPKPESKPSSALSAADSAKRKSIQQTLASILPQTDSSKTRPPNAVPVSDNSQKRKKEPLSYLLPLSDSTYGLKRPIFPTAHLDVGIGWMQHGLGMFESLTGVDKHSFLLIPSFDFPLAQEIDISLHVEIGIVFSQGGRSDISTGSMYLLYRPSQFTVLQPIIGVGMGYTKYHVEAPSVIITAQQPYPVFIYGFNLVRNYLDLLFHFPIAKPLTQRFEKTLYTIRPTMYAASLLISVRY